MIWGRYELHTVALSFCSVSTCVSLFNTPAAQAHCSITRITPTCNDDNGIWCVVVAACCCWRHQCPWQLAVRALHVYINLLSLDRQE